MLDQLWSYWRRFASGQWTEPKLVLEIDVWLSQHCVAADDFAFSLALALRNGRLA